MSYTITTHTRKGMETLSYNTEVAVYELQLTPARGWKPPLAITVKYFRITTHTRKGMETREYHGVDPD